MVEPSAFADTVTPPIFSPVADVIVPASTASAEAALGIPNPAAIAITLAPANRAVFMAFSPSWFSRQCCQSSARRHREGLVADRQGLHVRRNGCDLTGVVGVF